MIPIDVRLYNMKSFCSYFNQEICKSCEIITVDYSDQIRLKEEILKKALTHLDYPVPLPTIRSTQKNFRNKAKFTVTGTIDNPIIGLFGENNFDSGRELTNCPLHFREINDSLPIVRDFIKMANIPPYQISSREGELKGIVIFFSETTNQSYLRFILRSKESIDRIRKYQSFLSDRIKHLKLISANIQPIPHQIPEGEEEIYITSCKSIIHHSGVLSFSINPRAFVQTNQDVATKLYSIAAEWVKESKLKNFLELFCGQGAFSFHSAPFINKGLGIEINEEAVEGANETAKQNHKNHLQFKCADASKISNEIRDFSPDIILVNPPRRGLTESLNYLLEHEPQRIIYSSCNVHSLAEDLKKILTKYSIERIQIFDMFPNTKHFETLVELKLKTTH